MAKKRNHNGDGYAYSPWSGHAYQQTPTVDDLTEESMKVLQRHPAIDKALRLQSMDEFLAAYKAQHGIE